jgi:chromosomal replication initiation ATPase DnaA
MNTTNETETANQNERPTTKTHAAHMLIAECARQHGCTVIDIYSLTRRPSIVAARHEAMWSARQLGLSYPEIGDIFGKDHTTVISAVRKFGRLMR